MPGGAGGQHGVGYSCKCLLAIVRNMWDLFKSQFNQRKPTDDTETHCPNHARPGRHQPIMAPVIILGAIMVFVFWDTSDQR